MQSYINSSNQNNQLAATIMQQIHDICTEYNMSSLVNSVTCVRPTFSSGDDKPEGTVQGPDQLQQKGSIRENLCDSAYWAHQSGGQHILYAQGPVQLQLGTVRAAMGGKSTSGRTCQPTRSQIKRSSRLKFTVAPTWVPSHKVSALLPVWWSAQSFSLNSALRKPCAIVPVAAPGGEKWHYRNVYRSWS